MPIKDRQQAVFYFERKLGGTSKNLMGRKSEGRGCEKQHVTH
jgi:hypothetical protein